MQYRRMNMFPNDLLRIIVQTKMSEKGFTMKSLGEKLYKKLEYNSVSSALPFLNYIKKGYIYGTISCSPNNPKRQLDKLSIVLSELGILKDSSLIDNLNNLTKPFCFEYPPKNIFLGVS